MARRMQLSAQDDLIDYGNEDELMQVLVGEGHECKICMDVVETDVFMLRNCEHIFHKECLHNFFKTEIENSKCPLICPLPECKIVTAPVDMHKILTEEEMEKYQKYSFQLAVGLQNDISWCPSADCKNAFIYNAGVDRPDFTCDVCKARFCLDCRTPFHNGLTC
jgi:hypothetical protein